MPASTVTSYTDRENCIRHKIKSNQEDIKYFLILDEFLQEKEYFTTHATRYMRLQLKKRHFSHTISRDLLRRKVVLGRSLETFLLLL